MYEFLTASPGRPELWAWIGAYDHVVLAQLWGDMSSLPSDMPRYTRELRQYWEFAGRPALPVQSRGNHDAFSRCAAQPAAVSDCPPGVAAAEG